LKRLSIALTLALLTPSLAFPAPLCSQVFSEATNNVDRANQLLQASLRVGPGQAEARKQLQQVLKLDDLNFSYFMILFEKRFQAKAQAPKLYPAESDVTAYPVGSKNTPVRINSLFKPVSYSQVLKEYTGRYASATTLILKKLQAGTGSSMTRLKYFENNPQIAEAMGLQPGTKIVLGAKGTDLLAMISHPKDPSKQIQVPIAEAQLLQAYKMATEKQFGKVIVQDIVGPETQNRMSALWNKKSLIDPSKTYAQLFDQDPALGRLKSIYQAHVMLLDAKGKLSDNHMGPPGHGLFAFDALKVALHPDELPNLGKNLVTAIANGEDLNSLPDPAMVEWAVKNRAAMVLVTTTKTGSDKKGGIFVMVENKKTGEMYPKVLDTAEAKSVGQLSEFENSDGVASTNLTLFNYEVLVEKLSRMTDAELLQAMAPDLVPNTKPKLDKDNVKREYTQLEGTMGSVILNLDRYYRNRFKEALVHVINVETERRTDFFSPIKSAFDYFLQFHSSRFKLDPRDYKLKNQGGAEPPKSTLIDTATENKAWEDVQFVLGALKGLNPTGLQEIELKDVTISGIKIAAIGKVKIVSDYSNRIDLSAIKDYFKNFPKNKQGEIILKDVEIRISPQGVSIKPLESKQGVGIAYARVATSGSHTDYNYGFTLAALLPVYTQSTVTPRADNKVNIESGGDTASYMLGKEFPAKNWSGYIQGITHVMRQHKIELKGGFDLKISSNIPFGGGISSSAALVVSVMKALRSAYDLKIDDLEIARMGQEVEHFRGANTGLLDQAVISILDQDRESALLIDHSTMKTTKIKMPDDCEFVIIQSGLTHSLTDNHGTRNYSTRRAESEEAARILGLPHLSAISLKQLEARKSELSPLLYKRAHHVVSENERVKRFIEASERGDLNAMGKIISESHQSQRDDYDISEKPIDAFVSILQNTPGVYGASLTGGGFGGAVFALVKKGTGAAIAQKVMKDYLAAPENNGQYQPRLISPAVETK
jgi:galactokinase